MNDVQRFILSRAMQKVANQGLNKEAGLWDWFSSSNDYQPMSPEQRKAIEDEIAYRQGYNKVLNPVIKGLDIALWPQDQVKRGVKTVKDYFSRPNVRGVTDALKQVTKDTAMLIPYGGGIALGLNKQPHPFIEGKTGQKVWDDQERREINDIVNNSPYKY